MTSEDCCFSSRQKPSDISTVNKDAEYKNLNLNQNHECSTKNFTISQTHTINNKNYDHLNEKIDFKSQEKNKCTLCKSSDNSNLCFNSNDSYKEDKSKMSMKKDNTSNSTLSLHIAAYENFIETLDKADSIKDACTKSKRASPEAVTINQNPYEFPRQQNGHNWRPEIMHFKTSQRLYNPNQQNFGNPAVRHHSNLVRRDAMRISVDEDEQLRQAIELSKQTFNEEQRKRNNSSPEDLMGGDPDVIQRERNIAEITALYNATSSAPGPSNSYLPGPSQQPQFAPRSIATLPYGFRPPFMTQHPNTEFLPPDINSSDRYFANLSMVPQRPPTHHAFSPISSPPSPFGQFGAINSPMRAPFYPLNTPIPHNVVNHQHHHHTPVIVPFQAQGGNLIDLQNSHATVDQTAMSNNYNTGQQEAQVEYPELQFDDIIALLDKNSVSQLPEETALVESAPLPMSPKKKEVIRELKLIAGKNNFSKECEKLEAFVDHLKNREDRNVFFLAPTVDYFTTVAESIKLIIHRDETWPSTLNDSPDRIEMTYDTSSTCEDLLITVLFRFLNSDFNDSISPDEYTLKLYGTDEFLEPLAILGKHPVVGRFLSRGKDVELMIGKKIIRNVNYQTPESYSPAIHGIQYKFPRDEITKSIQDINNFFLSLDSSYSKEKCKSLEKKVTDLCVVCHNLFIYDILSALTAILAADIESHYKCAKEKIIAAMHTMLTMYCEATHSNSTMEYLTSSSTDTNVEIRESIGVEDEFLLQVESIHNLSSPWFHYYNKFYVEVVLMYGPKNISRYCQTENRNFNRRFENISIMFTQWIKTNMAVMVLPRETQVCVMVYGIRNTNDQRAEGPQEIIGSTSFPLFDGEGFLVQGKIAIPLKLQTHSVVEPWGPKPMIKSRGDVIIVLSTLEYAYKIQFPTVIEKETITAVNFSSLSVKDKNIILDIVDLNAAQYTLSQDDMQVLWSNRKALIENPDALIPTLAAANSWNALNLSNIYPLLDKWDLPSPQYLLDLLLPSFPDKYVRKCAIDRFSRGSSEFLINLIPQFLEALRFEIFEDSDLTKFLLEKATKDRRFATILYWELNLRATSQLPPYSTRCGYILSIIERLQIPNFREEIECQKNFMQLLGRLSDSAKTMHPNNVTRFVQSELNYINDKLMVTGLRLPIHPGLFCTTINIENCGVFNSLTKPVRLELAGLKTNYGVIYKSGDDLRQDAIVLQIVRLMNDLWLGEHLDLRMITYRILPTGRNKGLIELVTKCKTLREVQTHISDRATDVFKDDSIAIWLGRHNASEFQYRTAFDNFTRSCAGWCVATYILGIGDRHNDNILISESGHIFHIDFGKYMGDPQNAMGINRDRVPFVLTPEMVYAINDGTKFNTEKFQLFLDYCSRAFNILRRNCGLLLNIVRFMSCSSIPYMDIHSVNYVQKRLRLESTEHEATSFFTGMIRESVKSFFTRFNFLAHTVAQQISTSSSGSNLAQGREWFSFTNEVYTAETDGKIKNIQVASFEKWRNPSKVYMYVFKVLRQDEKLPSTIYRTFDEINELYTFLVRRFTAAALPIFDTSVGFGRTQIRNVAQHRQLMLQNFFSRFAELSMEITESDLVYTFFHAIHRDTNPDFIKDVISQNHLNREPPKIDLAFTVEEETKILKIFISHARNLPLISGVTTAPPDTYVKTYIKPSYGMNTKRKTDIVKNSCNPTYSAHIEYQFDSLERMKRTVLEVHIWSSGASIVRDNYKLCQTQINISKLFEVQPDRKGYRRYTDWFTLGSSL